MTSQYSASPTGPAAMPAARRLGKRLALVAAPLLGIVLGVRLAAGVILEPRLHKTIHELTAKLGPLDPGVLGPPVIPDSANADKLYGASLRSLNLKAADRAKLGRFLEDPDRFKDAALAGSVYEIVRRNDTLFQLIRDGFRRHDSNWGVAYGEGSDSHIPDVRPIVESATILSAKALLAISDNDPAAAIHTLQTGFSYSASLKDEPLILLQPAEMAMERLYVLVMREILSRTDPPRDELRELQALLECEDQTRPLHRALLEEIGLLHHAFLEMERSPAGGEGGQPRLRFAGNRLLLWFQKPLLEYHDRESLCDSTTI